MNVISFKEPQVDRFRGHVMIFHPHYRGLLLSFPAYDDIPGESSRGVYRRLVQDACYVVAHNAPGFLTLDREGKTRASDSPFLKSGRCHYHLDSGLVDYPVVADFAAWTPEPVPTHWTRNRTEHERMEIVSCYATTETGMSDGVKAQDGACIVTGFSQCAFLSSLLLSITTPLMGDVAF